MGQLKIDLAAKKLVASDPLLLGGPASSNPVEPDAAVAAAIQSLEGPVKALQGKPVGESQKLLVCLL